MIWSQSMNAQLIMANLIFFNEITLVVSFFFYTFAYMKELSIIGQKHKRIFVTFLKVNNAYVAFTKNYYEQRNKLNGSFCSINYVFNTLSLYDLFEAFFKIEWCEHPSILKTHYDRWIYWKRLSEKWKEFCYYQKYKYVYNIW